MCVRVQARTQPKMYVGQANISAPICVHLVKSRIAVDMIFFAFFIALELRGAMSYVRFRPGFNGFNIGVENFIDFKILSKLLFNKTLQTFQS